MTRSRTAFAIVSLVLAATPAGAGIFVDIPGIPGDAIEVGHEMEIVAQSLQLGGGQVFPKRGPKPCASPSKKTQVSAVTLTKEGDSASPKLFLAAAEGTVFPEITITLTDAASKGLPSDQYKLTNAFVGGYSVSTGGGGLSESLSLYFTSLEYTHFNPAKPEETVTWDLCG